MDPGRAEVIDTLSLGLPQGGSTSATLVKVTAGDRFHGQRIQQVLTYLQGVADSYVWKLLQSHTHMWSDIILRIHTCRGATQD
jgi:hypothetical protein